MNTQGAETPITNFSLGDLIDMSGGNNRTGLMRECVIAHSESRMEAFRYPCRIDALIIGVGCGGETTISLNMREHRLRKDSLFIVDSQNILQVQSHERFRAHVLVITPQLQNRLKIDIKHMMPLFMEFSSHPCLELSPEESQALRSFISMIQSEIDSPEGPFTPEIVSGLISLTIYKVGDILHRYINEHPDFKASGQSRADAYFQRFLALLATHYKQERSVGFYAQQLCVTPKYLTTLIKRVSDKSVSDWIDCYVIVEAQTLLRFSTMSIQEVAYHLHFPNQSFFGSYFKRITGLSPTQYKAQQ